MNELITFPTAAAQAAQSYDPIVDAMREAFKGGLKVGIFWCSKGSRRYMWRGSATSTSSTMNIDGYWRLAERGEGRLRLVDCTSAADGRNTIAAVRANRAPAWAMQLTCELGDKKNPRIVAIGPYATMAVRGASASKRWWDARIQAQGAVTSDQARALDPANISFASLGHYLEDAFGACLGDSGDDKTITNLKGRQ